MMHSNTNTNTKTKTKAKLKKNYTFVFQALSKKLTKETGEDDTKTLYSMTPNCSTFAGCSPKTRIILVHRNAMLSMRRDKVNDTK